MVLNGSCSNVLYSDDKFLLVKLFAFTVFEQETVQNVEITTQDGESRCEELKGGASVISLMILHLVCV